MEPTAKEPIAPISLRGPWAPPLVFLSTWDRALAFFNTRWKASYSARTSGPSGSAHRASKATAGV